MANYSWCICAEEIRKMGDFETSDIREAIAVAVIEFPHKNLEFAHIVIGITGDPESQTFMPDQVKKLLQELANA